MPYSVPATSDTPALIIYLLNVSKSMSKDVGGQARIDVVTNALQKVMVRIVQRSTKGTVVSPRYRIAMLAYSSQVIDLLGGVKTIAELAKRGTPKLKALDVDIADTAAAFAAAETLLNAELPNLQSCPAPLVCHVTDGEYDRTTGLVPIAKRILKINVPDGNVLIENVYVTMSTNDLVVSDNKGWSGLLARLTGREPARGLTVSDIRSWPGVSFESELPDRYSRTLFQISSPIPEGYLSVMREFGYQLASGARMFFPGDQPELVELAFAMSGTPSGVSKSEVLPKRFEPQPGDPLRLGKEALEFTPHPAVPNMVFGLEGRKSIVYQLRRISDDQAYALKVFKHAFRGLYIVEVAQRIAKYATLPGMAACQRTVLTKDGYSDLLNQYPDLEYAVLMPWVGDHTWYDMILSERRLLPDQSLSLARHMAYILANLESKGMAHCDVSGGNVLIDIDHLRIHLVDLEDMYDLNSSLPGAFPAGTAGYQHPTSRTDSRGQWRAEGDRFSGAIMLAEILGWHDPRILRAADDEHYFEEEEIQKQSIDCQRYVLMLDVLNSLSNDIAKLFEQAWRSPTLADCPRLRMWFEVIDDLIYRKEVQRPSPQHWVEISPAVIEDPFSGLVPQPLEPKKKAKVPSG